MATDFCIGKPHSVRQVANLKSVSCSKHNTPTPPLKLRDDGFEERNMGSVVQVNPYCARGGDARSRNLLGGLHGGVSD